MRNKKLITVLAAVLAMVVFAMGAYALISSWNEKLSERFEANPKQQEAMLENKSSSIINQSVTSNGMTMTAVQTLGDKNGMYILFKIDPPDGVKIDPHLDAMTPDITIDGGRVQSCSLFMQDPQEASQYSAEYYEVWIYGTTLYYDTEDGEGTFVELDSFNGKTIQISFNSIEEQDRGASPNVKIEGEWAFSWTIDNEDHTRVYNLGKEIDVDETKIVLETLELSPLSFKLTVSGIEYIPNNEGGRFSVEFYPEFVFSDGSVTNGNPGMGSMGFLDGFDGNFIMCYMTTKILDVDNVVGMNIVIGGQTVTVPLTK